MPKRGEMPHVTTGMPALAFISGKIDPASAFLLDLVRLPAPGAGKGDTEDGAVAA